MTTKNQVQKVDSKHEQKALKEEAQRIMNLLDIDRLYRAENMWFSNESKARAIAGKPVKTYLKSKK